MERHESWVDKLNQFLESNRNRPFERGVYDCALFAGLAIQAIRGDDFVDEYIAQYKTKKEAFVFLKSKGLNSLEDIAMRHLGEPYDTANRAKRGDIVLIEYNGEQALAVVDLTGRFAATPGKECLFFCPRKNWLKAWGV